MTFCRTSLIIVPALVVRRTPCKAAQAGYGPVSYTHLDVYKRQALQRAAAPLERFYEMYRELCDLSISEPLDVFVGDVIKKSGYEAMLLSLIHILSGCCVSA